MWQPWMGGTPEAEGLVQVLLENGDMLFLEAKDVNWSIGDNTLCVVAYNELGKGWKVWVDDANPPRKGRQPVHVQFRNGVRMTGTVDEFRWSWQNASGNYDIVAYKPL